VTRAKWLAVAVCVLLTAAAFIGSTGLFYAEYRPIRLYDLVAFTASWAGLLWMLWRDRARRD
jgi:hypothetical protein